MFSSFTAGPPLVAVFSNSWFSTPVNDHPPSASPHGRFAHALPHHMLYIAWDPSPLKLTCQKEAVFELSPVFRCYEVNATYARVVCFHDVDAP